MMDAILITLLSMTPIVGIRGALPTAIEIYGMDVLPAYFFSVLGEFIPVFIILALLGAVTEWLSRNSQFFDRLFTNLFEKTRRDYDGRIGKYGLFALLIYTAIPVPFSGAWTASLVIFLFGLPYWRSITAVFFGILLAGVNVLILMEVGKGIEEHHGMTTLVGVILLAGLILFLYHRKRKIKKNKENVQSGNI